MCRVEAVAKGQPGRVLKAARIRLGVTAEDLALELEVSPGRVWQWERASTVSSAVEERVCVALGVIARRRQSRDEAARDTGREPLPRMLAAGKVRDAVGPTGG